MSLASQSLPLTGTESNRDVPFIPITTMAGKESNKETPNGIITMTGAESNKESPTSARTTAISPNGGFWAWAQCASSFFLFFNSWGLVNSFGVFQKHYMRFILQDEAASKISWIGSLQASLLMAMGLFTGPLLDMGYARLLVAIGSMLVLIGMMLTSICKEYWHFIIVQGLVTGVGCGCLFTPSITILPMWFSSKKALAQGIGASGSSLGAIIYTIMFCQLHPRIGFGWATRVIAFVVGTTLVIPLLFIKTRGPPRETRRLFVPEAWSDVAYSAFGLALFFGFIGLYIPYFYIEVYAFEKRIPGTALEDYLIILLNAGSFFGRLIPNYLADRVGPMNVMAPVCISTAVLSFAWLAVQDLAGASVFCVLYGFFSGAFVSLPPVIAVVLSPSMEQIGVRVGMLLFPIAVGLLIGNPIAGAVLTSGWVGLQTFCGSVIAISGLAVIVARLAKSWPNLMAT